MNYTTGPDNSPEACAKRRAAMDAERQALVTRLKTQALEPIHCNICYTFICLAHDNDLNGSYFVCPTCRPEKTAGGDSTTL
jgi:hypothetical protein